MNPPPDACQSDLNPLTNRSGFTLIELLVVITVIGILAAITLNIAGGVQQKAAMDKARAEIAAISNALEQYKNVNDEYPATLEFSAIERFYPANFVQVDGENLVDPFGNSYQYRRGDDPSAKNPASFDLWTTDSRGNIIGNW